MQQRTDAMSKLNQRPTAFLSAPKEKKVKKFLEHGRDALALALSVASMQEEKALRKAEKHHQPQAGKPRAERTDRDHTNNRRKRLAEAMTTVTKQRAKAKKEKAKSRKESKGRLRRGDDANVTAPEDTTSAAPRKRVSFT